MKKTIYISTLLFSIILLNSCDKKTSESASTADSSQVVIEKPAILDSNFVLENITKFHSFAEIEEKFGKENLKKDSTILDPEGKPLKVSVLYPNTPEAVILHWDQKQIYSKLHSAVISCDSAGYKGKWHSKMGLQPGASLSNIVGLNGKDFTISGFGWDYSGHIVSWEGGKLDNHRQTGRFTDFGKSGISDAEMASIAGDTEFNVSLAAIKKLNPVLTEVTVFAK